MKRILLIFAFIYPLLQAHATGEKNNSQTSPNGKIRIEYANDKGMEISYKHQNGWQTIMTMPITLNSKLSILNSQLSVDYTMPLGKKSHCSNAYNEITYDNQLIFRVYNDGIAWTGAHDYTVDFSSQLNNWLMKWTDSYEGFFPQNREQKQNERYGYPALFEFQNSIFALLSESCITKDNAATSMWAKDGKNIFELRPDGKENGGWQTLIIGSLADIVESTLITDNSEPLNSSLNSQLSTFNWVEPGLAAWVYWANNHGSNDYNIIKKYTDMAIKLKLPYVLIDAEWDNFLPPYTVEDVVKYAVENDVKPLIWYSSSIGWLDGAPGPKFRLNTPEDREREFAWCEKIGIKGVKIDFFSGDTNQNIAFMIELIESAAKHHLLVNFHGATIPRGWQRTYPNLVSTEGVYGAEWYNNVPFFTDKAAWHNTILPFTRNVVGSMDYTPCAFSDSQHPHITTHAHELALTTLFESGIQHIADRPESILAQPQEVQDFLSNLPAAWDDTKFISGYPGDYVILARRKGTTWYVAGINGTNAEKKVSFSTMHSTLNFQLSTLNLFADSGNTTEPWHITSMDSIPTELSLQPRGGFVMVIKSDEKSQQKQ